MMASTDDEESGRCGIQDRSSKVASNKHGANNFRRQSDLPEDSGVLAGNTPPRLSQRDDGHQDWPDKKSNESA
jgi:hypothetical protein